MSFRKHINFTNFVIGLCIFFIAILLIITVPILINWICNPDSVTEVPSNIASTSTTLIVVLISTITLLITKRQTDESLNQTKETIDDNKKFNTDSLEKTETMIKDNRKYNEKTLQLTNETINQSEEIMYVQLRFHDVEKALHTLQNEIMNAWTTYNELLELKSKEDYFDPRGFIIAQYTIWTYNLELFEHVPLGLKNMFYRMSNKGYPEDHLEFEKYFNSLNTFSKSYLKKYKNEFKSHFEFNQFVNEFNENCDSGRFINSFKELYESDINAPKIINYLIQIDGEIRQRSIEDFIYEEKLLKINHRSMMRKINENKLNN